MIDISFSELFHGRQASELLGNRNGLPTQQEDRHVKNFGVYMIPSLRVCYWGWGGLGPFIPEQP